ncbi:energy-coupling factor ABC transporter substrate-binding protein [Magnetospira thiophila]
MKRQNIILIVLILAMAALPLLLPGDGAFTGTDGQAVEMIAAGHPAYEPWFDCLWSPPSGEVESLLFTLQAALGAGLLGYYIGLRKGKQSPVPETEDPRDSEPV